MADPYYLYTTPAAADGASIARSSFPGYIPSDPSLLVSPHPNSTEVRSFGSDYLQKDVNLLRMGPYGSVDDKMGSRVLSEPNIKNYNPFEDPDFRTKRGTPSGINPGVPDINNERPISKSSQEALPISAEQSNILFVGGLPKDCTRREIFSGPLLAIRISELFTRSLDVVLQSGDKALILCFVEFTDSKYALTAMEALQGYKFDDKKPDSPTLKIQFAHFPFRLPSDLEQA